MKHKNKNKKQFRYTTIRITTDVKQLYDEYKLYLSENSKIPLSDSDVLLKLLEKAGFNNEEFRVNEAFEQV